MNHDHFKMSQFHWHVVDSQSFPLTIPGFPELSQKGAYSSSEVYSSADVQDIVTYAGAVRSSCSLLRDRTPIIDTHL
jgi:N-acetyl-beta-hexosaminidase